MRGAWALSLMVFLSTAAPVRGQEGQEPGRFPWPGMRAYDVVVCARLVLDAGFVQVQGDGGQLTTVRVRDARGWKKDNGFYGLKINGEVVEEDRVYVYHWGKIVNLQTLFTYGSDTVPPREGTAFNLVPND